MLTKKNTGGKGSFGGGWFGGWFGGGGGGVFHLTHSVTKAAEKLKAEAAKAKQASTLATPELANKLRERRQTLRTSNYEQEGEHTVEKRTGNR